MILWSYPTREAFFSLHYSVECVPLLNGVGLNKENMSHLAAFRKKIHAHNIQARHESTNKHSFACSGKLIVYGAAGIARYSF